MKINKRLLWLVFIVLWSAVYFMLTPLVIWVSGRGIPRSSINITDSPHKVHYSIGPISLSDKFLKDVDLSGWSFVENDGENWGKEVKLVFVSEKQSYQVKLDVFDRGDLRAALPELKVPRHNSGFSGSFSPIAFKNGVYHLYIYNWENQQLYGVADTGRNFLKQNAVFKEMSGSEEVKVTSPDEQSSLIIQSSIDSCVILDNTLKVNGWAFFQRSESAGEPLIKIINSDGVNQFFPTTSVDRPDVAEYFGKEELISSGFSASIPLEAISTSEFTVRIFFEGIGTSTSSCVFPVLGDGE